MSTITVTKLSEKINDLVMDVFKSEFIKLKISPKHYHAIICAVSANIFVISCFKQKIPLKKVLGAISDLYTQISAELSKKSPS